MKTIIFKIGSFPLLSETFIMNQIVMAINAGYDVEIVISNLADIKKSKQGGILETYNIDKKIIVQDYGIPKSRTIRLLKGIFLIFIYIGKIQNIFNYYQVKEKFSLTYLYEWVFFQRFRKADIVHVQYGTNHKPIDDLKASGSFKMPVLVTFHGHDSFFPINDFIPEKGYYDRLFAVGELFTANTPYLKEQLVNIGCPKDKIMTIPMGVDTDFFYPVRKLYKNNGKIELLSVGRLEKIKGHDLGIKAVSRVIDLGYDVNYNIIGDGNYKGALEDIITDLSLAKQVKLLGAKSHSEIREYYWKADVFLMTSTVVKGNIRETQGLVSLEAQACGLPVVGFASGGVEYTIKDGQTGFLVEEEDVETFALKIVQLIESSALRRQMSINTNKFVEEEFSAKILSDRWGTIYSNFLIPE